MSKEQRKQPRLRVFLKGRIHFNNGASSIDCLVRDMSAQGARLMLSETATLPEKFDLFIPQKERTYRACLRWRREDGIGVTFDGADAAAEGASSSDSTLGALLRRVGELEAENAVLRRQLTQMLEARAPAL
ncbi:PilZ domain-containing protein [Methylobacterium sp. J-076]|uniref:PilZ domain-containing protein n=1 Tax=Methylobacterium sp. J-076 TaxID=2836655 RepID=UPI001FB876A8|nr:PilZ domain-containing protein [Methylobacterium sp. J-076]MCJ2011062.1 PilZ domain-containing protein [Methylobacterium sp. J-076]